MSQLKPLAIESIPKALVRAKHYRLLNEPWQAESICKDILRVSPEQQKALLYLILSITDQFGSQRRTAEVEARKLCAQLKSEYERIYYTGIIAERAGKIALKRDTPRASFIAFEYYHEAMNYFEKAEKIHPDGNEDAVLRWNACMRAIEQFNLHAAPKEDRAQAFLE